MASPSNNSAGIADDWDHVSDDNFSVVSIPASEADDEDVLAFSDNEATEWPTSPRPKRASLTGSPSRRAASLKASPPPRRKVQVAIEQYVHAGNLSTAAESAAETSSCQPREESKPTPPPAQQNQEPTPAPVPAGKAESDLANPFTDDAGYESDKASESVPSEYTDPTTFLTTLRSISTILTSTEDLAIELGDSWLRDAADIISVCDRLAALIGELDPILSTYANTWAVAPTDFVPLDPTIDTWMSEVRVKLLGLQAEMYNVGRIGGSKPAQPGVFHIHCGRLSNLVAQMDDFLPIIIVDFSEFQTAQMNFPLQSTDASPTEPAPLRQEKCEDSPASIRCNRRPKGDSVRPTDDLFMLRRALYRLKDEIRGAAEMLTESCLSLPTSAAALASDVAHSFTDLGRVLDILVSNHGSEWIEYGLSGGMSYNEFASIDPLSINVMCARLAYFSDSMGEKVRWASLGREGSPRRLSDEPLQHGRVGDEQTHGPTEARIAEARCAVLLENGGLDELESLGELLSAMLGAGGPRTPREAKNQHNPRPEDSKGGC